MRCEILCVGTELLLGDTLNTNAQFLAKELSFLGIGVFHQSVVGDNPQRVKEALEIAFSRSDIVITTGGLGPTKDDLTKEVCSQFFNKKLVLNEEAIQRLKELFSKRGLEVSESNAKQAYLPEGCIPLQNNNGTAPGCIINDNNKILIMLPGPPREVHPMFKDDVVPYLKTLSDNIFVSKVLRVFGIGESYAADKISEFLDNENPTVAPYAKDNEVIFRITANSKSEQEALKLIEPVEEEVRKRLGDYIYGEGEKTLEHVVSELLISRNLTIATAESCTGGLLAGKLINASGISSVFLEGAITYSNEAKIKRLNVRKDTLDKFGAVSEEVAREMAEGIAKAAEAKIGVSTTGIAGPGGGTESKPVGLVYVGIYYNNETYVKRLNLSGNRDRIRNRAVMEAIDMLRGILKD